MNQPPDPNQQDLPPTVYAPNSVPPTVPASQPPPYGDSPSYPQPGVPPYPPAYNQAGTYSPPGYPLQPPPPAGYPPQGGKLRPKSKTGWIIGGISAAVVIIIIAAAIITHGFRQEPPSNWLATQQSNGSKVILFIHWNNQDGKLTGAIDATSGLLSYTFTFDGTYDYQSHKVTLHMHANTQFGSSPPTLTGSIEGNTMTLHDNTSTTSTTDDVTFHSASQQEYEDAKQNAKGTTY